MRTGRESSRCSRIGRRSGVVAGVITGGDRCDRLQVPDRNAVGAPAGEVRQLAGVYNRLRMWALDGTWERVFTALMAQADADEDLTWVVSVDSSIVRAHQHAAGARKKGPQPENRGRPCHRPVPRRTDHQDPPRCGQLLPPPRLRPHRRTGGRRTRFHGCDGSLARSPQPRKAADPSGRGPGRQGVLLTRDPRPSVQTRHPRGDPGPGGSAGPRLRRGSRGGRPPAFDREEAAEHEPSGQRSAVPGLWRDPFGTGFRTTRP